MIIVKYEFEENIIFGKNLRINFIATDEKKTWLKRVDVCLFSVRA